MTIIIQNGFILDPSQNINAIGEIRIEDCKIQNIIFSKEQTSEKPSPNDTVIDATGLYVFPGLIDLATHLRDPGFEDDENITTGTNAAIKGGYSSVACMPDTNPPNDNDTATEYIIQKAQKQALCNVYPIGSISKDIHGESLAQLRLMAKSGCVAFSDGFSIQNAMLMRRALEYSLDLKKPLIVYPDDTTLSAKGVMNESDLSTKLGLHGIPEESEIIMIKRDIELAKLTKGLIHFASVSTKRGLDEIRRAKDQGLNVTASTCPHYFLLTQNEISDYNTNSKLKPPLRTDEDMRAIQEGIKDGTIDCIVSGHSPWHQDKKKALFDDAPFGISSLETTFAASYKLCEQGIINLSTLIDKLSTQPSQILGIGKGSLCVGQPADIMIANLNLSWQVSQSNFVSKGKHTPFNGMTMNAKPVYTIIAGKIHNFK